MHATKPIVILGPTAGGKSELAVRLAEHLADPHSTAQPAGEVIGADAFQVYRHLDAGTAKPDADLRRRAPHHLIDIAEPTERFTVHDWLTRAKAAITEIQALGRRPIVVGGTNLYLKALLDGMFDGPPQDAAFRRSLDGVDTPLLHERLAAVDPQAADRVKPADRQRVVRALEVYEQTGTPISELQTQWREGGRGQGAKGSDQADASNSAPWPLGPLAPVLIGLRWSPEAINPRINLRVKAMFYPDKVEPELAAAVCINGESLIDEVQRLNKEGHFNPITVPPHADAEQSEASGTDANLPTAPNQAREALGYKQILASMQGTDPKIQTIDDAFEKTKVLTRRFAKQQRTWLKRFTETRWIDCDEASPDHVLEQALAVISVSG